MTDTPIANGSMVTHKPARECPISQPHLRGSCGIVRARERVQESADADAHRSHGGCEPT